MVCLRGDGMETIGHASHEETGGLILLVHLPHDFPPENPDTYMEWEWPSRMSRMSRLLRSTEARRHWPVPRVGFSCLED